MLITKVKSVDQPIDYKTEFNLNPPLQFTTDGMLLDSYFP